MITSSLARLGRQVLIILTCLVVIGGCTTLEIGFERSPQPHIDLTSTTVALQILDSFLKTEIAKPSSTLQTPTQAPATSSTTPTTTPTLPSFSSLRFSTHPDTVVTQRYFVEGTPRIYAIWDYENMDPSMTMRRIWRKNGEDWIIRDEKWNMTEYGQKGTINDISIYDEDIGLEAGEYSLTLAIEDREGKQIHQLSDNFWILPHQINSPIASPNKTNTAFIDMGGRLIVEDAEGNRRELVVTQEISDLAWFPNERHIIYTDRDRSHQVSPTEDWGITHKLWIIDTKTNNRNQIGTEADNYHSPVVSSDGRYVALLAGETRQEGCQATPELVIFELSENFSVKNIYNLGNFSGLPFSELENIRIIPQENLSPGDWQDENQFLVSLSGVCFRPDKPPDGNYLLDLNTFEATKVSNLR